MSKANYSEIKASNGVVVFDVEHPTHEQTFDRPYTYFRVYRPRGEYKIYINNSSTYIVLCTANAVWEAGIDELVLEGIQINQIKIEAVDPTLVDNDPYGVQYYLMR